MVKQATGLFLFCSIFEKFWQESRDKMTLLFPQHDKFDSVVQIHQFAGVDQGTDNLIKYLHQVNTTLQI